jgi:uncharacterized membrane-anchored protein YjiN (DUF445 family)
MLTPNADDKIRDLRRMKALATGAFLVMTGIFFLSLHFGNETIFWVIRWDHINAFAEASMVGALADWFAVVALFKHPLGLPIWHTAIIPRKKNEIGRNLGNFVETRLLSVANLAGEIERFSASKAAISYLDDPEHRRSAAGWVTEGVRAMVRAVDDDGIEGFLGDMVARRLRELNAADLLGGGLEIVVSSGRHNQLIDQALHAVAAWLPSRRDTVQEFIERSMERMLKWGSRLVPSSVVERATDQPLSALIEIIRQAAADPEHPLRADLDLRTREWITRLKSDPEWQARVNEWKDEIIAHPGLRSAIRDIWARSKEWVLDDIDSPDSTVRSYALRGVESLHARLQSDTELQQTIDRRLRSAVISLIANHHHEIGAVIQRIVDAWDAEQLSRELELNLGRDLQYIRLNGTVIGGIVGLLIHLVR